MHSCFRNEDYILQHMWAKDETDYFQNENIEFSKRVNFQLESVKEKFKGTFLEKGSHLISHFQQINFGFFSSVGGDSLIEVGLMHEIAHAIQLKKSQYKRIKQNKIFDQPRSSCNIIMGGMYYEPMSAEPTINECETVAIQLHLLEFLKYKIDHDKYISDWADTLTCGAMPDYFPSKSHAKELIRNFINGYYLAWVNRQYLMEKRFENIIKYIG